MGLNQRDSRGDWLAIGILLLLAGLYVGWYYDFQAYPMEDAAMLLRYSGNLADGHGIVWNVGEAPVDGATDFLFMVMVGGLHKLGLGLVAASRLLTLVAHFLLLIFVFRHIRREYSLALWAALLPVAWLALGPGPAYIEAAFGTPFFALFVFLAFDYMMRLRRGVCWPWAVAFAAFGLLAALTRPEGAILVPLMGVALLVEQGFARHKVSLLAFLLVFVIPGAAYFFWRWTYFGHPFPNPFYVRNGGGFSLLILRESVRRVILMGWPFLLLLLPAVRSRVLARKALVLTMPLVLFTCAWAFMRDEMNYNMRFQYAVIPILACLWPLAWQGLWPAVHRFTLSLGRRATLALGLGVCIALLGFMHYQFGGRWRMLQDSRYEVGQRLAPLADEGYVMAVTEAGYLPFASEWKAVDTYGLNDARIAAEGGLTWGYLQSRQPDLIMFHEFYSPLTEEKGDGGPWSQMCDLLKSYAEEQDMILAAAYGITPGDAHYYYVASDLPHTAQIVSAIRDYPYFLGWSHEPATDFSRFQVKPSR